MIQEVTEQPVEDEAVKFENLVLRVFTVEGESLASLHHSPLFRLTRTNKLSNHWKLLLLFSP
jgi:hypothetical protein